MRIPGALAALASSHVGSPAGLAASASMCGNVGSGEGAVATLEMLESQAGWGDKIQPHPWIPRPAPPRPSRNWGGCPMWDRKAPGHRPRDERGPVHFLWTWTLAYSECDGSGLGAGCLGTRLRWTMSRSA